VGSRHTSYDAVDPADRHWSPAAQHFCPGWHLPPWATHPWGGGGGGPGGPGGPGLPPALIVSETMTLDACCV
jgi:hypothetical protein